MKMAFAVSISLLSALMLATPVLAEINTPGGKTVFENNDNPAPGDAVNDHPSLTKRSQTAKDNSGNAGAWEAHQNSNMPEPNE